MLQFREGRRRKRNRAASRIVFVGNVALAVFSLDRIAVAAAAATTCVDDSAGLRSYAKHVEPAMGISNCSYVRSSELCEDEFHGPVFRIYCPKSCESCQEIYPWNRQPSTATTLACTDNDLALKQLYPSCRQARCTHPAYGNFLRERCQVSCGVCASVTFWLSISEIAPALRYTRPEGLRLMARTIKESVLPLPSGRRLQHVLLYDDADAGFRIVVGVPSSDLETVAKDIRMNKEQIAERIKTGLDSLDGLGDLLKDEKVSVTPLVSKVNTSDPIPAPQEIYGTSGTNCLDDDSSLASWANLSHFSLRGCLDVATSEPVAVGTAVAPAPSTMKLSAGGLCNQDVFGRHIRQFCPRSCGQCEKPFNYKLVPLPSDSSGGVKESVPFFDLEQREQRIGFYFNLSKANANEFRAEEVKPIVSSVIAFVAGENTRKEDVAVTVHLFGDQLVGVRCTLPAPSAADEARLVVTRLNAVNSWYNVLRHRLMGSMFATGVPSLLGHKSPQVSPSLGSRLATCSSQHWSTSPVAPTTEYFIQQLPGPEFSYARCQESCAHTPGGRLLSCIPNKDTYDMIKDKVLQKDGKRHNAWIGLMQPRPTDADEPVGTWTWPNTHSCKPGYMGVWFPGDGTTTGSKQPDNGKLLSVERGRLSEDDRPKIRENCAAFLDGYNGSSAQAFDVPCYWRGRAENETEWLPNYCLCETAKEADRKVPTCSVCRPPFFPKETACMYETFGCTGVRPSETCTVSCKAPYIGDGTVTMTCPTDNSNPFRFLTASRELNCGCPAPPAQKGYTLQKGQWKCASGYAGSPELVCSCIDGSFLQGCQKMLTCQMPRADKCRLDVSDCESLEKRMPGSFCTVRCRTNPSKTSMAYCPAGNTVPDKELEYNPLPCALEACDDPVEAPEGFNKTSDGKWVCAQGYYGIVKIECMPNETSWSFPTCSSMAKLSGCTRTVNCRAPPLTATERCKINFFVCDAVEPGSSCELGCKFPFEGLKTSAHCPNGNTDPGGLVVNGTLPSCKVVEAECDKIEPAISPAAYMKLPNGWACANSYTGAAEKTCDPNEVTCELEPNFAGCAQVKPCTWSTADCRYDAYNCLEVQPGSRCDIGCKAPYSGIATLATCSKTNSVAGGLELKEGLPECVVQGCGDPIAIPEGYRRTSQGWKCDDNFTDLGRGVQKKCAPADSGECSSTATLHGCVKVEPCMPLEVDECWYDVSACSKVQAGQQCEIKCIDGWQGRPGVAECPAGNTDSTTRLQKRFPDCECEDPRPSPAYQWDKDIKAWKCSKGYAGQAVKRCLPGPNCSTIPVLDGCYVPVPCEVAPWLDSGSTLTYLTGHLRFGPASVGNDITEEQVFAYRVYFASLECERFGDFIAEIPKADATPGCCRDDHYSVRIEGPIARGSAKLVIVAVGPDGESPDGGVVNMEDIFGQFQEKVLFSFRIVGLNYTKLVADGHVQHVFETALKESIVYELIVNPSFKKLSPQHVTTILSDSQDAGVVVNVVVTPPYPVEADDVAFQLSSNPAALIKALLQGVLSVDELGRDGIKKFAPIRINDLDRPRAVQANEPARKNSNVASKDPCRFYMALLIVFLLVGRREFILR